MKTQWSDFSDSPRAGVGFFPLALDNCLSDKSDMKKTLLQQAISARLADIGKGPVDAALGVPGLERNYISEIVRGKKKSFSASKQHLVAEALRWTVPELLAATGIAQAAENNLTLIPIIDLVSAGKLKSPLSQIPPDDWDHVSIGDLGPGDFFALKIQGDSMDQVVPDGAVVVINRRDRTLVNGKCYVFSVRGQTTFKSWQGDDVPHLAPLSYNKANKPVFIKKKSDLEVIGRAIRAIIDM